MTIKEMQANGYTRYAAFITKYIVTKKVEVWAKDWDDAHAILEEAAETLPDSAFEERELPEISQLEHSPEPLPFIAAAQSVIADCNERFYGTAREDAPKTTPTQQKITEITNAMRELLLYKNQKYGDSALKPKRIFHKGNNLTSILIRLDDKLSRVMENNDQLPRINDVADIIGYCTLLLIGMGATADDIQKLRD